ncbi:hypothetical protein [Dactylosporangium sp. CA-092794]|uniref:hypothetical protein n=1 Tax=Dactylosporangium sp. CA-092794 TaxID=3239929 RepID=UPI003D8E2315
MIDLDRYSAPDPDERSAPAPARRRLRPRALAVLLLAMLAAAPPVSPHTVALVRVRPSYCDRFDAHVRLRMVPNAQTDTYHVVDPDSSALADLCRRR